MRMKTHRLLVAIAAAAPFFGAAAMDFCGNRAPDAVTIDGGDPGDQLRIEKDGRIFLKSQNPVSTVELSWKADLSDAEKSYRGDWERTYGTMSWGEIDANRPHPWYCLVKGADRTDGYGVEVQPAAFARWHVGRDSIRLVLDVRAGNRPVRLRGRELELCRVVSRRGKPGERPFIAGREFCRAMCPKPRLPKSPVYGFNDWYCSYGSNTAENFFADAKEIVDLCEGLENRPFLVVDDGWQNSKARKGDAAPELQWRSHNKFWGMPMDEFCRRVKAMNARPGLWYRPLWDGELKSKIVDPTDPRWEKQIREDMACFRAWGIELVKIDFITFDWGGTWHFKLLDAPYKTVNDWADDSRTGAEVVRGLYRTMREAAGDNVYIIGCNALDHFAAGLFELQRIGDDTSGKEWSRTRKMGPNTLGMRSTHDRTFYAADADCVALYTRKGIPWRKNRQWLDLVARSGTSLFISWKREFLNPEIKEAFRKALKTASKERKTGEPLDWTDHIRPLEWRFDGEDAVQTYNWN